MTETHYLSISEAQDRMASGTLTARSLTEAHLARIDSLNPTLNAFVELTRDQALMAADASDARRAAGESLGFLDGIPIAVKCNFSVKGLITSQGIKARDDIIAAGDANAVVKLKEHGAVILGTTTMDEGGLSATGMNPYLGDTKNPHDDNVVSGGSSSGSAAAVSSGMAMAALGTDAAGSTRIPAAYCGIVGLKPSKNLIDNHGLALASWTFESAGTLARSADDCFLVLAGLLGIKMDPAKLPSSITGLTLGVPRAFIESNDAITAEAQANFENVITVLKGLGANIKDLPLAGYDIDKTRSACWLVAEVESAEMHEDHMRDKPEGFSEHMMAMLKYGAKASDKARLEAVTTIVAASEAVDHALISVDALITPSCPTAATSFDTLNAKHQSDFMTLASVLGVPAMAVPCGMGTETGLPLSFQVITSTLEERKAMTIARAYERVTNWNMTPKT